MLIQFTVSAGSSGGWGGLLGAIKTAATAAAGTTPTIPANVATWNVLDNTTAGGWTVITDGVATVNGGLTGTLFMTAPMKKTDVNASTYHYKKGLSITADSSYFTTTTYAGVGNPQIVKYRSTDGVSFTQTMQPCGTSPINSRYDGWLGNTTLTNLYFYISVTSEYLMIYSFTGSLDYQTRLLVISDHSLGHPLDHTSSSLHAPFYGMLICNSNFTTANTSADSQYFDMYMSFVSHLDPTTLANNALVTGAGYLTGYHIGSPRVQPTQNYMYPLYPPFFTNANANSSYDVSYIFRSDFNSEGFEKFSVNDIVVQNISRGYFPRTLAGIKQIGVTRTQYTIDVTSLVTSYGNPRYVTTNDSPAKTYLLVSLGKNVFGLPKT